MDRRTLIGGGSAAAALVSTRSRSARAAAVDVVVFGDSYSQVPRAGFPNWVTQLQTTHSIGRSDNFAKSGATAAKIGTNHLARQLRLWRQAGRPVGDWVIVFIGTNDILQTNSLTASKSAINAVVTELRAAGARLLLIEPLNVGKTPRFAGDQDLAAVTKKTKEWDRFLRSRGLPVVRLYDVFAPLLPNAALFHDDLHLTEGGHGFVANAVRPNLTL